MPTLTVTEISQDIVEAIAVEVPQLSRFTNEFTDKPMHLGQTVIAHLDTVPAVGDYNPTTGYVNQSQEARTLLTDLPITLDGHKHVTISFDHLNAIADKKVPYLQRISKAGYALGKYILDSVIAKMVAANLTHTVTEALADTDRDTLASVRALMNTNGAYPTGRWGIVNSTVASKLTADARIASGDYDGQRVRGSGYVHLNDIEGFGDIFEYPELPATGNRSGVFGEQRTVSIATALPDHSARLAQQFGIPAVSASEVVTDPSTGLSLLSIRWMNAPTQDIYLTLAVLFGSSVGAQGGVAGSLTDDTGVRLVTL